MATVLLIGTLDTKGPETAYLRDRVREQGCDTLVLDSGILGEAVGIVADFNRAQVAEAAGTTIDALRNAGTRGKAVEGMLKGVRKITLELLAEGKIHGAVSLGGAEGAVLAAAAMKELPIGFPKLIVSPLASGQRKFAPFVGIRDVMVMHSVVDILGLNPISRTVFNNAAAAIVGMAKAYQTDLLVDYLRYKRDLLVGNPTAERILDSFGFNTDLRTMSMSQRSRLTSLTKEERTLWLQKHQLPEDFWPSITEVKGRDLKTGRPGAQEITAKEIYDLFKGAQRVQPTRPAIAATMLGNTTKPLMRMRPHLEERGWDFVIFHANGVGGLAMEELITQGQFAAVLDYTLSEVAGQIAGGFHVGGQTRLDAAAQAGIPQLIVPGCLDFIVFGAKHEIPDQFKDRPTYYHNPEFTLVRLTPEEQMAAAQFVVEKLNRATGPVSVIVPLGGGSVMDIEGGAFWLPEVNRACWNTLRDRLNKNIRYREIEAHINSDAFADAVLDDLLQMLE